jgi:predicted nucleic acid-binding protein
MSSARIGSDLGEGGAYVDTSAFVKLVRDEPDSAAMEDFFRRTPLTSSAALVTEFLRAVRRDNPDHTDEAIEWLEHVHSIPVGEDVLLAAGLIGAPALRSMDAIHLVTALMLYPYVSPLITYDRRLAAAAQALGQPVASPRQ